MFVNILSKHALTGPTDSKVTLITAVRVHSRDVIFRRAEHSCDHFFLFFRPPFSTVSLPRLFKLLHSRPSSSQTS